jgi:uncharacterized membrane protein SpoIIM required for sporulation
MNESLPRFVERRRPDWEAFSQLLDRLERGALTLEEIAALDAAHRRAAADLAVATAAYPGTDALRYLNQLCARAYQSIYTARPERGRALKRFFAAEFPQAVRAEWKYIAAAAALLAFGMLLDATALWVEPGLAVSLISPDLREFVARGRLWTDSLLEYMPPSTVATSILTNNIQVTVMAFGLGLTGGLGTIYVLIANGRHIGGLVMHCAQNGLGPSILTFMAAHGFVELSIICITGGAGLMVGQALIAPGERARAESLRLRAGRAVRMVLGCAPFLAAIGVVEGFVSPGDLFAPLVKVVLGATLGVAFWTYLLRTGRGPST